MIGFATWKTCLCCTQDAVARNFFFWNAVLQDDVARTITRKPETKKTQRNNQRLNELSWLRSYPTYQS
jgi:hypothetical protein